jgi:HEAT repeat protein
MSRKQQRLAMAAQLEYLSHLRATRNVQGLIKELANKSEDDSFTIRGWAARSLGKLRAPESAAALGDLLDDPEENVRIHAAWALREIHDPCSVPALCRALADPSIGVVTLAAQTLGAIGDESALANLAQLLGSADWPRRLAATRALADIGSVDAVELLRGAQRSEPHARRRWRIRAAILMRGPRGFTRGK